MTDGKKPPEPLDLTQANLEAVLAKWQERIDAKQKDASFWVGVLREVAEGMTKNGYMVELYWCPDCQAHHCGIGYIKDHPAPTTEQGAPHGKAGFH